MSVRWRRWKMLLFHLRVGTLGRRLWERFLEKLPLPIKVRWEGADSSQEALAAMAAWGMTLLRRNGFQGTLLVTGEGDFQVRLVECLRNQGGSVLAASAVELQSLQPPQDCIGVLCTSTQPAEQTAIATQVARDPFLCKVPFEFVAGLSEEQRTFEALDEYSRTWFVSPVLLDRPSPYEIYQESLNHFEQKCGLRDYLDLYQVLRYLTSSGVAGDIAEFGSFRGHSGYLIAKTLEAMGSSRRIFLFDMFEEFPVEATGVDHFWNASHYVDFDDVRSKFECFPNVSLVKGDFTQTFAHAGISELALAYIDCDSYRATRHMIDAVWDGPLQIRGALVCEDYGHPALLGNRVAVQQALRPRPNSFQFFSQFSGLHIALKL